MTGQARRIADTRPVLRYTGVPCPHPSKVKFADRTRARKVARELAGRDVQPYECVCGAWHLGGRYGMTRAEHRAAQGWTVDMHADWMPAEGAARELQISPATMALIISAGKIRTTKDSEGAVFVSRADVDRFKEAQLRR